MLDFSKVWKPREPLYDAYSFKALPLLGKLVANDSESYRYLAEPIRVHPSQVPPVNLFKSHVPDLL